MAAPVVKPDHRYSRAVPLRAVGAEWESRKMRTKSTRTKSTPPQVAERFGVSADKVLAWVRSGELRAIDAATRKGERPRYLIDESDLAEFERSRAVVPPTPVARAPRRRDLPEVPQYV